MPIKQVKVGFNLPIPGFGESGLSFEGTWEASEEEVQIAWSIYVELVTRIVVAGLPPGSGNLREALNSLHAVFLHVRKALHDAGPVITLRQRNLNISMAEVLLSLINQTLRPLLSVWHPLLLLREQTRPLDVAPQQHENDWGLASDLIAALEDVRRPVLQYVRFLEAICDIRHSPVRD